MQLKTGGSFAEKPLPRPPLEELWYDFEQDRYLYAVAERYAIGYDGQKAALLRTDSQEKLP